MSRHSHWAKIKRGKGATDSARGNLFSKLARLLTVAAREGGGDPTFNFKLRLVMDRARAESMSKDAIERAVARGAGSGADAVILETVMYEAIAPGGVGVLIECLTDNRNRALGEVKGVCREHQTTLASEGSVRWQFQRCGVVRAALAAEQQSKAAAEQAELALIEAGAEDIREDGGQFIVLTKVENLQKVREAVERIGLSISDAGLEWIPKQVVDVPDAEREKIESFLGALDELDDVQETYTNARGY
ncbi:MAG: YebC/PmpR family DNA-binding transcriptional regulator [Candidatus Uhrbacteria bacterium]